MSPSRGSCSNSDVSSSSRSPSPTSYFEDSLFSLFSHNQPAHGDPGDTRTYSHPRLPQRHSNGRTHRSIRYGITKNSGTNNKLFAHFQWDAGLYLADMIAEQSGASDGVAIADVMGKSVVELGSGTGLPGLVACRMGASSTVLTDYPDELILENLRSNVSLATSANSAERSRIQVLGLAWGEAEQEAAVLATTGRDQGFDIVLAADVLWVSSAHSALIQSIRTLLRRRDTARCVLIAGFHTGRPAVRRFFEQLATPSAPHTTVIVPDWETKHGGIWERHVDGTERGLEGWGTPSTGSHNNSTLLRDNTSEDMGDISDRGNWVVVASLRWADLT